MTARPLDGVRIVSIAVNLPGPVAVARLVADGATAVKIEPPWGDPLRALNPEWYEELHAGVETRVLDLKSQAGAEAIRDLLAYTDIFIASHRPAALGRLGLDAEEMLQAFPHVRYLNIVGNTAQVEDPGHDLTYQAQEGLVTDRLPLTLLADMTGAERAYATALLLLRDEPGARREVGLFDCLQSLTAPIRHGLTAPGGPLGGANPAYGVYAARGGHVAVAALEPHFRQRLYAALGLRDSAALTDAFHHRTPEEWEAWAAERDIPLAAVR
ncbi:MAG: CoA transferase [Vicinamibacterales bacterium]